MGPETSTMPKQGHIPVIPLHIYVASSNVRNYINIIQNTYAIWNIVANQYPIGSMYGIFTYIYHQKQPNVGKYTIHGSYGYFHIHVTHLPSCYTYNTCVSYLPYGSNLPSPRPRSFIFHSLCNAWLFDSWCCWKAGGNILACIHLCICILWIYVFKNIYTVNIYINIPKVNICVYICVTNKSSTLKDLPRLTNFRQGVMIFPYGYMTRHKIKGIDDGFEFEFGCNPFQTKKNFAQGHSIAKINKKHLDLDAKKNTICVYHSR